MSRFEDLNNTDLDNDEFGVSYIFFPLQSCKRKLWNLVADNNDCIEVGGFRGAKALSKVVAMLGVSFEF